MTVQISRTAQSPLRGQDLRTTTMALMRQIGASREFAVARMQMAWQGDRIVISAGNMMAGTVDFRDGNPSTVAVYMRLSGPAELPSMVQRVNAALDRAAVQLRAGQAAAAAPATAAATQAQAPAATGRTYDPARAERAAGIMETISRSFGTAVTNVFGPAQPPAPPAVIPDLPGRPPATPGVLRPTGKPLPPSGYEAPLQPYVAPSTGVPWGWIAGGAVAVTGVVLLASLAKSAREERERAEG